MSLDQSVVTFLDQHRTVVLNGAARATMGVTTNGITTLTLAAVAVAATVRWRLWRIALAAAIAVVVTTLVGNGAKALIDRPRPAVHLALVTTDGSAMPSTSTAQAAAAAFAGALLLADRWPSARRGLIVTAAVVTAWVGFCVVYLGAHWPCDAVVGAVLGVAIGWLTAFVARRTPSPRRTYRPARSA